MPLFFNLPKCISCGTKFLSSFLQKQVPINVCQQCVTHQTPQISTAPIPETIIEIEDRGDLCEVKYTQVMHSSKSVIGLDLLSDTEILSDSDEKSPSRLSSPKPQPFRREKTEQRHQDISVKTHHIVQIEIEYVPISIPSVNPLLQSADVVTIGDLHGNTHTLIILLIQCGILSISNIVQYRRLCEIITLSANFPNLFSEKIYEEFRRSLYTNCSVNQGPRIRLLGDTLADRMSNDVLTLALIGRTQSVIGTNLSIIFSNHDNVFIQFLTVPFGTFVPDSDEFVSLRRFVNFFGQCVSIEIKNNIRQDLLAYASCLNLFEIEFIKWPIDMAHVSQITIFSHAALYPPNAFNTLKLLIFDLYNIRERSFEELTVRTLERLILCANQELRNLVVNIVRNWSAAYIPITDILDLVPFSRKHPMIKKFRNLFYENRPGSDTLWFRLPPKENPFCQHLPFISSLPKMRTEKDIDPNSPFPYAFISLANVHGHDLNVRAFDLTLDNMVGKIPSLTGPKQGSEKLTVLCSKNITPSR